MKKTKTNNKTVFEFILWIINEYHYILYIKDIFSLKQNNNLIQNCLSKTQI